MILYYHAYSDCVFLEQYEVINWSHIEPCDDVSDQQWAVDRYNEENPGYRVHLMHGWATCSTPHDHCTICNGGLGFCEVCRQGECELTTDCPGTRPTDEQNAAVCAGKLDYWSGVWLETPRMTDKDVFAATVNSDGQTYDGRKVVRWLFEAVTGKAMSKAEADKIVEEAKQLAKDRKNASA